MQRILLGNKGGQQCNNIRINHNQEYKHKLCIPQKYFIGLAAKHNPKHVSIETIQRITYYS